MILLYQEIIAQPEYLDGQYDIHWLEKSMKSNQENKE